MKDVYGINTPEVQRLIDRVGKLTEEEIEAVAARDAAWDAALDAAWDPAWDAALDTAWDAARVAAAIVVMDLITEEQFQIVTEPFAEILTELGIVWEGK
jgi:hypothetical protein